MSSRGSLVLLTGINGFISGRTAEALLQAGFSVRGTARSRTTTKAVTDALSQYKDRLEIVEVKDITVPGAFDEAVKGVTYIAHLASPVAFNFEDPEPIMHAAVNGTTRVLESALKEPGIKAVVLLTSVVAIMSQKTPPYTFTEADWNQQALDLVRTQGKGVPSRAIYGASKVAAEQAFWKFREDKKPHFTQTAVAPSFVTGAPLVKPTRPEEVALSESSIYRALVGLPVAEAALSPDFQAFVDVRDVARLVIFGFEHREKADGERFLATGGFVPQQAVHDVLRKAYPTRRDIIDEGKPGEGYVPSFEFVGPFKFDNSKAVRATGTEWISPEESILQTAKAFEGLL